MRSEANLRPHLLRMTERQENDVGVPGKHTQEKEKATNLQGTRSSSPPEGGSPSEKSGVPARRCGKGSSAGLVEVVLVDEDVVVVAVRRGLRGLPGLQLR